MALPSALWFVFLDTPISVRSTVGKPVVARAVGQLVLATVIAAGRVVAIAAVLGLGGWEERDQLHGALSPQFAVEYEEVG
jgi:hypothetical protein